MFTFLIIVVIFALLSLLIISNYNDIVFSDLSNDELNEF